jgi:glycogen debranching enzyme
VIPTVKEGKTHFAVRSPRAQALWLCLFDGDQERRVAMQRNGEEWLVSLDGDLSGARYGYRATGEWAPERGLLIPMRWNWIAVSSRIRA